MAETTPVAARQEWFRDGRTLVRRMRVEWDDDRRVIILSLWLADFTRATFQLRPEDAPRLIAALSDFHDIAQSDAGSGTFVP